MRAAAVLLVAAPLALSQAALAQQAADKVRLDDFALPGAADGAQVEQLGVPGRGLIVDEATPADRAVVVPPAAAPDRAPVAQLSSPADRAPANQLNAPAERRELAPAAVSSRQQSRPNAAVRLAGADRCDPQANAAMQVECESILELRAAEFAAAEPPRLSPEQVLLAERGDDDRVLAAGSSEVRLRVATAGNPDADARSNQELAALYLFAGAVQPPPDAVMPGKDQAVDPATVAEALQALQIDLRGPGAP